MPEAFSYDVVRYPCHAVPAMHPDRLFVQGRLFGQSPAPANRCRYLEVGAGSGTNVIAAALHLPDSEFVGLDLAETAVREGNELIGELGLKNVRLEHADLTQWQPDGAFDYVCAHGVYSWVPEFVRDGLMALAKRALGPHGVGYISYNALPGCHLRQVIWDMLRLHTANTPDPADKLAQSEQFLQFLCEAQEGRTDPPSVWVKAEADSVLRRNERYLTYHDDLSANNNPVYFLDFARHAQGHGLAFLAEAELPTMADEVFPENVARVLAQMGQRNNLFREQYRDFVKVRRFRASLLCHADQRVRANPDPGVVGELLASTTVRPVGETTADGTAEYVTASGNTVTVDHALTRTVLSTLAERAPERVPVSELAAVDNELQQAVLTAAKAGLVTLHGQPLPAVRAAGDRPKTTRLARVQATRGMPVTTALHNTLDLTDAASQALVPLLDGTRDRMSLAAELRATVPTLGTEEEVRDGLDITLVKLAKAGVIVA